MQCMNPFRRKDNPDIPLPCGKCPACVSRRTSGWSFRLMQQSKICISADFITLTYSPKFLPMTANGFMDLRKRDLQLFFKRLRKAHPDGHPKISYYACGEYGGKTMRPHYHVILFNSDRKFIQDAWAIDGTHMGHVHYGTLSEASAGYTLKYLAKPSRIPLHKNDDRQKEFSLMSKDLGPIILPLP